ncbi:hypothetical protein HOU00_gp195 [Caulobacter phage CcrPW]|uniref:Uncharacterized protein n=1 Tax=Caulobacter phage CcrPW TaxID=2283271 RepID=A0A385EBA5_9CAUD|nr:hypothetical protein HOU00_gp195 [Caulobacter phage CcrPW]AXQ68930.1 hypothetical protein CcrPW_gp391c [Caulobacter phage CcrPW]
MLLLLYMLSFLLILKFGQYIICDLMVLTTELGYRSEPKPKRTAPARSAPKLTARDAVVGRMGFSGRGVLISRGLPPPAPMTFGDEGCHSCEM